MRLSFREVEIGDAELLLTWRTKNRVTRFMNTDMEFDIDAQKRWLDSCYSNPHYYHWIIESDRTPIGLISITDLSIEDNKSAWGFYIGSDEHVGIGGLIPPYLYNFCFGLLGVNKIEAEVFFTNTTVIKLHQMHGYKFVPNRDRTIEKYGREILLIAMELDKETFLSSKFLRFNTRFPIERWQASPISDLRACPQ